MHVRSGTIPSRSDKPEHGGAPVRSNKFYVRTRPNFLINECSHFWLIGGVIVIENNITAWFNKGRVVIKIELGSLVTMISVDNQQVIFVRPSLFPC